MSENKRYYWLKLQETFFEDDTIDFIESQENGEKYVLFYLKLCLKALKYEGKLIRYVGELLMPYDEIGLSKLTKTDVDTVRSALILFSNIGLIKRLESGEIYLTQLNELIGSETSAAQRKRIQRIKQKNQLECDNVTEVSQNGHTDIEIDKEQDKDIETTPSLPIPKFEDYEDTSADADVNVNTIKRKSPYSVYYALHYQLHKKLYEEGKLSNSEPIYNYPAINKKLKTLLNNPFFTEERLLQAIQNASEDDFVIRTNKFSLLAILANDQINKLVEGRISRPTQYSKNRTADLERGNMNTGHKDYTIF